MGQCDAGVRGWLVSHGRGGARRGGRDVGGGRAPASLRARAPARLPSPVCPPPRAPCTLSYRLPRASPPLLPRLPCLPRSAPFPFFLHTPYMQQNRAALERFVGERRAWAAGLGWAGLGWARLQAGLLGWAAHARACAGLGTARRACQDPHPPSPALTRSHLPTCPTAQSPTTAPTHRPHADEVSGRPGVYFVTMRQLLAWMEVGGRKRQRSLVASLVARRLTAAWGRRHGGQ